MPGKSIKISPSIHSDLRKEAANLGVQIKELTEMKLKKGLSKEDISKIKNK